MIRPGRMEAAMRAARFPAPFKPGVTLPEAYADDIVRAMQDDAEGCSPVPQG